MSGFLWTKLMGWETVAVAGHMIIYMTTSEPSPTIQATLTGTVPLLSQIGT